MKYFLAAAIMFNISICSAQTPKGPVGSQATKRSTPVQAAGKAAAVPETAPAPKTSTLFLKPFTFLNLYSEPEGAEIFIVEQNVRLGQAPVSRKYNVADMEREKREDGCVKLFLLEARWVSGATATESFKLCEGTSIVYGGTFVRPKDAPFADRDENYAAALLEKRKKDEAALGDFSVTLRTIPEGAEIFQETQVGVKSMGRSPVKVTFQIAAFKRLTAISQDNCMRTRPFLAHWPSGARSKAEPLAFCNEVKTEDSRTIERPAEAPGLSVDQNFAAALMLERVRKENSDQQAQQAQWAQKQAQEQANQRTQQFAAQEAQRQADQDAREGQEALVKGILSLIPQRQPSPAPTQLTCVTKPRFGKLETVCE